MNIVLVVATIGALSFLLSLRSMKQFLPQIYAKAVNKPTNIPSVNPFVTFEPPRIIDSDQEMLQVLINQLENLKANNLHDLIIEKVYLNGTVQYIVYSPQSQSLWPAKPAGYIVDEVNQSDASEKLAEQFIIRHKYNDVYYFSYRSVTKKPENYHESGVDEILWQNFYAQHHSSNPQITISSHLKNKIFSMADISVRRTANS